MLNLKTKPIKLIQIFFSLLLLIIILFELIYFLHLKPFFYPFNLSRQDFQISFTPQNFYLAQIKKMTLEEKVGRLFIIGFKGYKLSPEQISFFKKNHFCNFLINSQNIKNELQLKKLIQSLKSICQKPELPSIIAIDQEGGLVSRINFLGIDNTSQVEIKTSSQAAKIGQNRGKILKNLGFNVNFAPVLEIANSKSYIAKRAFLGNEGQIYLLAQAMINGYQQKGIVSVVKHFPGGLGRTNLNPHQTLPVLKISLGEMAKSLYPYQKLIKNNNLVAIMITHLKYPQIDKNYPSSLSKIFITQILRHDLGFKGVVITDDLAMKAISNKYQASVAAQKAFQAGADLILISSPNLNQQKAYEAIWQSINKGIISKNRINESIKRILRLPI